MKHWQLRLISSLLLSAILVACGGEQADNQTSNQPNNRLSLVKQRGKVICGINGEVPGFSFVNENGEYTGLDVDICRAVAAALFDDPTKVEFRKLSAQERFTALQTGEVDLLSRNTTLTLNRDTIVGLDFGPTVFYDGQGIMVTQASNIEQLSDLSGKSICVLSGTTSEQNLTDTMRQAGITEYTPVVSDDVDALYAAYQQGRCEAVTADRSQLVSRRSLLPDSNGHKILDTVISKEPLSPAVASGDAAWSDAIRWITFSLIQAEEFGINSKNLANFDDSQNPNIRRFLGMDEKLGEDMGLPNQFTAQVVKHVGNYGEIYERNIGKPLGLERGQNNLWTQGGLMYSPPFR